MVIAKSAFTALLPQCFPKSDRYPFYLTEGRGGEGGMRTNRIRDFCKIPQGIPH